MNSLQKELFSKVYDLLMDSPKRLTQEDAEIACKGAINEAFNVKSYILAKGDSLHSALVHWAWSIGWHKSLILDELYQAQIDKNTWAIKFEVAHEERVSYEALVKKEDGQFLVLEVK